MITSKLFKVAAIPLFNDNYSYAIFSSHKFSEKSLNQSVPCYLVDPADSQNILSFLNAFPTLQVSHILYTHKHYDHIGNPQELLELLKQNSKLIGNYKVIASQIDGLKIPTLNYPVFNNVQQNNDNLDDIIVKNETLIEEDTQLDFLYVPCHTTGHTLYHFKPKDQIISTEQSKSFEREIIEGFNLYTVDECIFTGDTLFIGGCGRFFEGNAKQMLSNMDKIEQIPNKNVKIFCGHEYTKSNLEWSSQIEKENTKLQEWYQNVLNMTQNKIQTIPSTLQNELDTNVFMRAHNKSLKSLFKTEDPVSIMNSLRAMKNANIIDIPESHL